ncbi:MAG TPA: gas vesicle protein GvpG [Pseudonocardiaceae bacterium]|nr:gas vesicle protein GvpG [Pseudonocardiaceae bacterium]
MGVFSSILLWPLAPVRGVVSLGEVIQRRIEEELRDPIRARNDLEAAEQAYREREISADELARTEQDVLDRMRGLPGTEKG